MTITIIAIVENTISGDSHESVFPLEPRGDTVSPGAKILSVLKPRFPATVLIYALTVSDNPLPYCADRNAGRLRVAVGIVEP